MMILAEIEVIELANSPQQQHCLDTDDSDEQDKVNSADSAFILLII